jgi:hypothetical protein
VQIPRGRAIPRFDRTGIFSRQNLSTVFRNKFVISIKD